MKRFHRQGILIILIAMFMLSTASAFVISPSTKRVDFTPDMEEDFTVRLANPSGKAIKVNLRLDGELAQYAELDDENIEFDEGETKKEISYSLKLPESLVGTNVLKIYATEDTTDQGPGGIHVTVSAVSKLEVIAPYEGKFLDVQLKVQDAVPGSTVRFSLSMRNYGTETIKKAVAYFDIKNPEGRVVASGTTSPTSLKANEKKDVEGEWVTSSNDLGSYTAKFNVHYDEKIIDIEKIFRVGEPYIEIIEFLSSQVDNTTTRFNVKVENTWNEKIKMVESIIQIQDETGKKVAEIKSSPEDIDAFGHGEIISYWQHDNLLKGEYEAKVMLKYGDKTTKKDFSVNLITGSAKRVPINEDKDSRITLWIILTFSLTLMMPIIIYFIIQKKKNKR